ncbi:MAG TPA: class I SAM-dependent methyltransferase [Casimicrobiaceae bacterium]|nr:class I SAM-dependent methyltransferase [Casimicrobiaceae bacterium]
MSADRDSSAKTAAHGRGHAGLAPSPWIVRFAPLVAPGGRVLDLAAGYGRHARFFAGRGAQVVAVDRDAAALATLAGSPRIETRVADVEDGAWPFPGERFDAIVVVNYLHRALFTHLLAALAGDGVLLYETFALGNAAYGKPSNPAFLLEPGELLEIARQRLVVVAFEQGHVDGERAAVIQRLAAVAAGRSWPPRLPGDGLG